MHKDFSALRVKNVSKVGLSGLNVNFIQVLLEYDKRTKVCQNADNNIICKRSGNREEAGGEGGGGDWGGVV